ncbi:rod shape-determining protein MreC [Oceanobacillus kimchii]|uniref:rod shape-determining protein MreC n=1 Tax=Oceanobacillus kimchii TaxID=746691 RepID=UPI0021A87C6D|nr:rod shape-determining protein MreC [Oceanobacillus kimchii]MCT1575772.1 rod shape-determining protein MreC [Oceanobacillus kimchii]MCT2135409.1 rod shape-determining protein MreC [Oceanobacillus kimchii]
MQFLRSKKLFIILIGVIVLVALIGYSLRDRENMSFVETVINDTVGWVQNTIHAPVSFVTGIISNIDDMKNTYEENQVLREQIAQQNSLLYDVQKLEEENEELREIIGMTETVRDYEPIHASVISRSPEQWMDQVTINRGSDHGVEANMVVITADGMIGKVLQISNVTATVQLLTGFDEFNRISATITKEDDQDVFGMIEGFDKESNSLLFRIIEESEKNVEEGDIVYSSEKGGKFPAGLKIGEVKEIVSDQYGLTRIAMVEPAADLYDINNVIVVDRAIEQPQEMEENADEEDES